MRVFETEGGQHVLSVYSKGTGNHIVQMSMTLTSWWALIYIFVMTVICVQTETL